jgi:hypothetical protein
MIPVPSPPTDNFYKFVFVAGISLVLVSQYAKWTLDMALIDASQPINEAKGILSHDQMMLKPRAYQYKDLSELYTKTVQDYISDSSKTPLREVQSIKSRIEPMMAEVNGKAADNLHQSARLEASIAHYESLALNRSSTVTTLWALTLIGLIGSVLGGFFWYWKHQRYLDIIQRNEARQYWEAEAAQALKEKNDKRS